MSRRYNRTIKRRPCIAHLWEYMGFRILGDGSKHHRQICSKCGKVRDTMKRREEEVNEKV